MKIVEYKTGHEERLAKLKVTLSNPLSLCWQVTKKCNYNCSFCLSGEQDQTDLPLSKIKSIIDVLAESNLLRIDFTGGEPFLRSDFCKILTYASEKGIETLVTSNGSIWSEKIASTLLETNTLLLISLDGDKEIHDKSRGKGAYSKAVENIKRYRDAGIPLRINCLIRKDNVDKIDYVHQLVKDLRIDRLFFILIAPQGKAYTDTELLLSDKERVFYLDRIKALKKVSGDHPFITIQDYSELGNHHSCFLIDSKGDVISQGYSQDDCIKVGNILTDGLGKCWNNPIVNHKGHFLQYSYMFNYYM
ncbi:MAG: radical SAM protein [Candidatus Moranbacteria bacterium]|nr:radical SAM protein [Candidatus Moranbacteria bacterium]